MNKPDVSKIANGVRRFASQRSPEILIGIGLVSAATTVILTAQATVKAVRLLDEKKKEKITEQANTGMDYEEVELELTKKEIVQTAWKPYVPAAVTGAFSVACILGANSVHAKRNAALAAAYEISTSALSDYREKVVETIGEKKERTIREKMAADNIASVNIHDEDIIYTGNGNTLFYDPISNRVFKSSQNHIERCVNELNHRMGYGNEPYMSLNEFYEEIGLPPHDKVIGDGLGWRIDKAMIDLSFPAGKTNIGEPCLYLEFNPMPEYGYDRMH